MGKFVSHDYVCPECHHPEYDRADGATKRYRCADCGASFPSPRLLKKPAADGPPAKYSDLRDTLRQLAADGRSYARSRQIARHSDLSANVIGRLLAVYGVDRGDVVDWNSESDNNATIWKITIDGDD